MMKLLIVDDSNVIRRAIERMIGGQRFEEVRTAGNGVDALKEFDAFEPDVVTMDITMPELDGLSCVDAILAKKPDTLILVISALADKATAVEAIKRGAQGFLLKPFTPEMLDTELTELFEN
ncbi:MAG TPA: response regulator [Candidatus Tumulicola sp.]|nr:response regulator [Candidatus Tumulicola sp.]